MMQRIKQGFAGGIFGAMIAVFFGQKVIPGVEGSVDKTWLAIGGGFIVGAIIGAVIRLPAKKPNPPPPSGQK